MAQALACLLGVRQGVTAVIGSGGKTTLLHTLAAELAPQGRVVLTTSTHIRPSAQFQTLLDPSEAALCAALAAGAPVCIGSPAKEGKLTCPQLSFSRLAELADFVLVEADGSRGLPLKAHLAHEPVIPPEARRTVCVVGASGLGRPIAQAVHRSEVFCAITGAKAADPAAPALVALAMEREALADIYYVNQCDLPGVLSAARELAAHLARPVVLGSLLGDVPEKAAKRD